MKVEEIRKLTGEELAKTEKGLREELGNLTFQHRMCSVDHDKRPLT